LEEVDNEFDKWKMAMTVARGALDGGVLGAMGGTFFQLLNKAVYGVGLYAKAEERIGKSNVFQSALQAGGSAALALTNVATVGAVGAIGDMVRGSTSRGQLALQDHQAQLALQHWYAPGVQGMFPGTQIVAYSPFAQPPTRAMTYPYGVNALALPSSSSNAALPSSSSNAARLPRSSYDFNEYPTISQQDLYTPPWLRGQQQGQGRGYGGPTEVDSIKGISAFSNMTPAQQALYKKPQLVVSRATKARTKGGAKTIKGLDPVLEFNEAADDPYLMRQQVN
jgi:hypothetical protein